MTTIQLTLPTEVFASLRRSPHELAHELRLAAALLALAREGVDAFVVDFESLRRELAVSELRARFGPSNE